MLPLQPINMHYLHSLELQICLPLKQCVDKRHPVPDLIQAELVPALMQQADAAAQLRGLREAALADDAGTALADAITALPAIEHVRAAG